MPNDNNKKIFGEADEFNNVSANNDILDLDVPEKKPVKKAAKKTAKKKVSTKKVTKSKKTSKTSTRKASAKKTTSKKTTSKKKVTKRNVATQRKNNPKTIEDELLKVTNIKSVDQVKKPRKIALMLSFYAVIVIAIIVFCLIKFSKPNKNNLLLEETINYEYLTEEIETTTERIVVESSNEVNDADSENNIEKTQEKESETTNRLLELTTKSVNSYKETTEKEETTKKPVETTEAIVTKAWPVRTNINELLPRYKEVIYPYSVYNQMTTDELGIINTALTNNYNIVKDKVFGENVTFANKGMNGIIYLNYTYLQEYLAAYAGGAKQYYDNLPYAPYYNYIMNDKFNFDYKTYTTNLNMRLDFKNAKNQGEYFEVPATVFEPSGVNVSANAYNKFNVRVLKNAKIGYTESFSLTALLEVLDIECNTKHNPFFSIDDVIGSNPKVLTDMIESGFDVRSMIDEEIFNYILFDKKGYITALYMLKS